MVLSEADVQGRWAADESLALWASYDEDNDPPVAFWTTPSGSVLCCDCASNFDAEHGYDDDSSPLGEEQDYEPRLGCDDCSTVIAFD
jgi:hypothetical protein